MTLDDETFVPLVAPSVFELRPDYVALSVVVRGGRNAASAGDDAREVADTPSSAPGWAEAHLQAWREAFQAFGARPQRTPCSAEALRRRLERDGKLPRINAVVDLYNALSAAYAVPIGGEDLAKYRGLPRLLRASGVEPFETMREGAPAVETVDPGEVVWCDDAGVTCRRWNWRQTTRTRLEVDSTDMWFVIERLGPLPLDALQEVGDALVRGVQRLAPDAQTSLATIVRPA
jgi:DNA/RNA-binding domain of Phe-tRNA-synthetase-like protein